jgi:hypothetical protein
MALYYCANKIKTVAMMKLFEPQNDQRGLAATMEFAVAPEPTIAAFLPNPLVINGLPNRYDGL